MTFFGELAANDAFGADPEPHIPTAPKAATIRDLTQQDIAEQLRQLANEED